jgi:endonuclease/exonuclease/phosphatase family metal-dependent hydrolase
LIKNVRPDVVALQEAAAPKYTSMFAEWNVCRKGELLVAARRPLELVDRIRVLEPPHKNARSGALICTVHAAEGDVTLANVHLPSPSYGLYTVLDRYSVISPSRRHVLQDVIENRATASAAVATAPSLNTANVVVLGDFNMPVDSAIYRRDWAGRTNAFSQGGWGLGHTVHGSRRGLSSSARIDHILTGKNWTTVRSWVGPDVGSDHMPVIADLLYQPR